MTRAYKRTSTPALQVLTGLPPLDLQLAAEADFARVTRLGITTENYFAPLYSIKASKHPIPLFWEGPSILDSDLQTEVQIYTDGSKLEGSVGSAFCSFHNSTLLFTWQSGLQAANSVFQAELLAIQNAITWFNSTVYHECIINSDSMSGLQALKDLEATDYLVQTIQKQLINSPKLIHFRWIRGHSGQHGNELADSLAKEAATNPSLPFSFVPLPTSSLKYTLKTSLLQNWQELWNLSEKGRYTFNFLPKINKNFQITNRSLILFLTNHGPFQTYLFKINRSPSPLCICGELSESLHYVTTCPLTTRFHVRRDQGLPLSGWFSHVLKNNILIQKIISFMIFVEENEFLFKNPGPLPQHMAHMIDLSDQDDP